MCIWQAFILSALISSLMFDTDCDLSLFVLLESVCARAAMSLPSLDNDKFFVISYVHTGTLSSFFPIDRHRADMQRP